MNEMSATIEYIVKGQFHEAILSSRDIPFQDLRAEIILKAYDDSSLAFYGFYVALLLEKESPELHHATAELLSMALNVYPGAYQLAFYHAQRAAALAPQDISFKEFLLFFHNNPEELMSPAQSLIIAQEILRVDPQNETAKQVIANVRKRVAGKSNGAQGDLG